jgi:hypothetical protein
MGAIQVLGLVYLNICLCMYSNNCWQHVISVEVNGLLRAVVSSSRERFIAGVGSPLRQTQTGVTEGNRVHHRRASSQRAVLSLSG